MRVNKAFQNGLSWTAESDMVNGILANPYGSEAVKLIKRERFLEQWQEASDAEKDAICKKRAGMTCPRLARLPAPARVH